MQFFCYQKLDKVKTMTGDEKCITLIENFTKIILNEKVLQMVSYFVKMGILLERKRLTTCSTADRFFLKILQLNGLARKNIDGLDSQHAR